MTVRTRAAALTVTIAAVVLTAATPSSARAEATGASICEDTLLDLEETRTTLQDLERSVTSTHAKRGALRTRSARVVEALLVVRSEGERATLEGERARVQSELALIERVLPPIAAQVAALSENLQSTELAYLDCVEATLD